MIERGSISSAAEMVHISQPAMSKLIAHFEADTGLKLFDRLKGRLAPTECGMRLYKEIERIFTGVRQVENAAEAIRREERTQLVAGILPALSGSFIQRATTGFRNERRNVFCSVQSLSSQWIVEWLVTRKLDVGLVEPGLDNPYLISETVMEHPLVCIMPVNHPLAARSVIVPGDLDQTPFVSLNPDSYIAHRVQNMFEEYKVRPEIVLVANVAPTLCEFVAAGFGVSLVHPLVVSGLEQRLAVRRFEPDILFSFQLCRSIDSRNTDLIETFAQHVRATAAQISSAMLRNA